MDENMCICVCMCGWVCVWPCVLGSVCRPTHLTHLPGQASHRLLHFPQLCLHFLLALGQACLEVLLEVLPFALCLGSGTATWP